MRLNLSSKSVLEADVFIEGFKIFDYCGRIKRLYYYFCPSRREMYQYCLHYKQDNIRQCIKDVYYI